MAVREIAEATLWKSDQNDNGTLNRELDACEKEDRSLNNLVAHIGEAVMRHAKNNKLKREALALGSAFSVRAALEAVCWRT
jgi:hypothetical protein